MKKQTATDWLYFELVKRINPHGDNGELWAIHEQAEAMHKEQIENAWDDGDYAYFHSKVTGRDFDNGEQYYNETYNK